MEKINPVDWVKALKYSSMYAEDYKAYLEEYKNNSDGGRDIIGIFSSHTKPVFDSHRHI